MQKRGVSDVMSVLQWFPFEAKAKHTLYTYRDYIDGAEF